MLHAAMSKVTESEHKLSIPGLQDQLTEKTHFEIQNWYENSTGGIWEESWLCEILNVNSSASDQIHKLTQNILVATDVTKPSSSGSVFLSHHGLVSSDYCPRVTFSAENECAYLVDKPADFDPDNLDQICSDHLPDSHVHVFSASAPDNVHQKTN